MSRRIRGWRRIAAAMWNAPNDPQIYGAFDVDATDLRTTIEAYRAGGHRVTPTHFVGRALAQALRATPHFNVRLWRGRAIPRKSVDVFFVTAVDGGNDLSGVKIERADEKSLLHVADELTYRSGEMKKGRDPDLAKTKRAMSILPGPLLRRALSVAVWLTSDLDWSVPPLGLRNSPFGSAMVTSVGMFGLPMGFAPLAWMYQVPIMVLAGEITDKPVAVGGRVEVRPMLPITATIDHRYADGWHIGQLLKPFREYLESPSRFEPRPDAVQATRPVTVQSAPNGFHAEPR